MSRLFRHAWRVLAYEASRTAYFAQLRKAVEIVDLRVQFSVEKHLQSEPNTATVTITNAARTTRSFLETKPLIVQIAAGYDGVTRHLFTGDLRFGSSTKQGTEWITELQLGDGDRAHRHARVARSYAPGTPVSTALRECAEAMGLDLPAPLVTSPELATQFSAGVSLSGPARDEMTKLLAPYGYHWSIQDGKLVILRDTDVRADQALVVSEDTGMLGSPEFGAPEKPDATPRLTVRTLLYPEVTPGGKISVQSRAVTGLYKITRVTHSGDSHGDEWVTEIEAIPT